MLDRIGFYTLSEQRAQNTSLSSPIMRAELIITDRCNFKCQYCRGLEKKLRGDVGVKNGLEYLNILFDHNLRNVRFSGGEPTLNNNLPIFIHACKRAGVERIAISTNGSAGLEYYKHLVKLGVNDFSISLDSGCCSVGERMAGGIGGSWDNAVNAIRELSKITYVTVGMVFNQTNVKESLESVEFAKSLNPSDIRIISSAQYDKAIPEIVNINLNGGFPILKYRINNYRNGIPIRGLGVEDTHKCPLVLDDLAIAGGKHFPCIIHMRERGEEIGNMTKYFREERALWYQAHDTHTDPICRKNCLDVCRDYNNTSENYKCKN
jgi:sulfatase maturation enzyme AslB (radical SAM superfamily)